MKTPKKSLAAFTLALAVTAPAFAATPAFTEVKIQDLTIVAEKGVSPAELKKALVVASANITWPQSVTQGNLPNAYTNANNPYTVTAGSIPNGLTRGNFPNSYTSGLLEFKNGEEAELPLPNTNL